MAISITLNNREETFDTDLLNIDQLLKMKNYTFKMMVVKINGDLVKRPQYAEAQIKEGDDVMILHLISGG